jgi:hypothetical protein
VRISYKRKEHLTLSGRTINDVETFLYLESIVTEEGVSEQDMKIASARHIRHSFNCLQHGNLSSSALWLFEKD